jgi:twitching motility protein PilI
LSTPFELLLEVERRSRARARGFPAPAAVREAWVGIAFWLKHNLLVAPLNAVTEVVTLPRTASVPGVKPWVLGIANMRGTLLPIIDLQGFFFDQAATGDFRMRRVLVVECGGHPTGLLVDAVTGMKRFWADAASDELPALDPELRRYVHCAYQSGDQHYALFDLPALLESERFVDVAV